MELIQQNDKVLFLWDRTFDPSTINTDELKSAKNVAINFENVERLALATYANSSFNVIISKTALEHGIEFLASLLKLLKPQGRIAITTTDTDQIVENLKLAGFVRTAVQNGEVVSEKPNYEVGSAAKLSFGKNAASKQAIAAVWKLDQDDDEQEEIINADDLLDEEDKIKPDPSTLKVCGTTGKRKACKDCSCGLAEELATENENGATSGNETQKSSCGSCYLGDAFRCASCPYLGLPAFKPGEKVQLAANLLKDDLL